ncbi:MAG TPA: helix-turn-helix domain-containing protein [Pirellulales bacterium]
MEEKRAATGRLLSAREIAELLSVCAHTIRRWVKAGRFPTPLKLGRTVRWSEAAVQEWIAHQVI